MTNAQQPPPGAPPGPWGQQVPPAPQQAAQQPPQQQAPPQQPPPAQQLYAPPPQAAQPQQQAPPQWPQQPTAPQQQQAPQQQAPASGGYAANPFAGLTSGDPSMQRLPYLEDGSYKIKINAIRFKSARSGKQFYIIEVEIVESNNPMRPAGMRCSCFINMSDVDTRGQHIAAFISSVWGVDPTTVPKEATVAPWVDQQTGQNMSWQHYAEQSLHDTNPWAGIELGVHVLTIKTQAGNDFSLHTWVPVAMFVAPAAPPQPAQPASPVAAPQPGQQPQWAPPPGQPPPGGPPR